MRNKTLLIKGSKWLLKYVDGDGLELEGDNGKVDYKNKVIYLSKTPDCAPKNVYWHEYLHAYFWECGIRDLSSNFEHVLVENLADLLEKESK